MNDTNDSASAQPTRFGRANEAFSRAMQLEMAANMAALRHGSDGLTRDTLADAVAAIAADVSFIMDRLASASLPSSVEESR